MQPIIDLSDLKSINDFVLNYLYDYIYMIIFIWLHLKYTSAKNQKIIRTKKKVLNG